MTLVQRSLWLTSRTTFFEVIFRVRYWVSHVRRDQQICHRPYRVAFPPLLLYVDYHNGLHSIYFLHYGLRANYRAPHDKSVIKKHPDAPCLEQRVPVLLRGLRSGPVRAVVFFCPFFQRPQIHSPEGATFALEVLSSCYSSALSFRDTTHRGVVLSCCTNNSFVLVHILVRKGTESFARVVYPRIGLSGGAPPLTP